MNLFNMLKKKEQALAYLTLQYSANLKNHLDFNDLCDSLRLAMLEQGIFPKAGVRVKAHSIEFYSSSGWTCKQWIYRHGPAHWYWSKC